MEEYENPAEMSEETAVDETATDADILEEVTDHTSTETEEEGRSEKPRKKTGGKILKITGFVIAGLVLALCLTVVIYWGCIGVTSFDEGVTSIKKLLTPKPNDVFYKESYSVSNEELMEKREEAVAVVGDRTLNNGTLQVAYWMNILEFLDENGYYAIYYGLDYTKPLDQQTHTESGGTWQQYFLTQALNDWQYYQAMAIMGQKEDVIKEADLENYREELRGTLTEAALEGGYSSIDAMLTTEIGPGCTVDDYSRYMEVFYAGYSYLSHKYETFEITDADLEKWFADHESELKEQGITKESGNLMDVRHILIPVEGGTEDEDDNITYSDAEWETCRTEAQKVLDLWLAGDATEESFMELAEEYSEDPGSNTNGGLYEGLNADSGMVQEFTDWYMDESRQPGDYGLIKTKFGYHIMYFSGSDPEWVNACRNGCMTDYAQQLLTEAKSSYPMEVTYKRIVLGDADLTES